MEKVGKSVFTIPLLLRIETKLEMCIDKDTSVSSNKNSKMFDSLCVCVCVFLKIIHFSPFERKIIPSSHPYVSLAKIVSRCTIRGNYVIN